MKVQICSQCRPLTWTRNRTLTIKESHFRFDGCSLHQWTHHHRKVLLKFLPQDLTHARPCRNHVGDLEAQEKSSNTIRETLVLESVSMICLVGFFWPVGHHPLGHWNQFVSSEGAASQLKHPAWTTGANKHKRVGQTQIRCLWHKR